MGSVLCHCGELHFGWYGAAGLVLVDTKGAVLLTHRSARVHHPGTWAFPGGAIALGETVVDCAIRETVEEVAIAAEAIRVLGTLPGLDHEVWSYTYVLAALVPEAAAEPVNIETNWEAVAAGWIPMDQIEELPLHPGVRRDWPRLRAALPRP